MMSSEKLYFGGCEGGASHSILVIVDQHGNIIGEAEGGGTNQFIIGMEECCKRIHDIVIKAKIAGGLPEDVTLSCLGLSLSGADHLEKQKEISDKLLETYPDIAKACFTCNDTLSPLCTATDGGGVVLIAGTGSNCMLANPSGYIANCGGWGHLLGDKGSASWIVLETLKTVYEEVDGLNRAPYNIEYLKNAMFDYFEMTDMFGILPHLYPKDTKPINKLHIAKFCVKGVVKGAEQGDMLSLHMLKNAGIELGKHVKALIPKMDIELFNKPGGVRIICVGSIWKSWIYLKEGFLNGISPQTDEEKQLKEFTLVKLKSEAKASIGAAAWAAKRAHCSVNINYSKMSEEFFKHQFNT